MNNDLICRHCGVRKDDPNRDNRCDNAGPFPFHAWATRDEINRSVAGIMRRWGRRR